MNQNEENCDGFSKRNANEEARPTSSNKAKDRSFRDLVVRQLRCLFQYIYKYDKVQIEKLVKSGVDGLINATEPEYGVSAMHAAVATGNPDMVIYMISLHARLDIPDKRGCIPLMLAAELGFYEILAILATSLPKSINHLDAEGKGVLFHCVPFSSERHARCVGRALAAGADIHNVARQGMPVFQLMCQHAQRLGPTCQLLLDKGVDPNSTNTVTGVTALMEVAKAGSIPLVRAILQIGGNPNAVDAEGLSVVHYAVMSNVFEIVSLLSAYSADMGVVSQAGNTPLHYAAKQGNANCCKFLAQRGCSPLVVNLEGVMAQHIAKCLGQQAAVKELRKAEKKAAEQVEETSYNKGGLMEDVWALKLHDWSCENEAAICEAFGETWETEEVTAATFATVLTDLKAPVDSNQLNKVIAAHDDKKASINVKDFLKGNKYIEKAFLLSAFATKEKNIKKDRKKGKKGKGQMAILPICTAPLETTERREDTRLPGFMTTKYYEDPEGLEEVNKSINYFVRKDDLESLDLAFKQGVPVDITDPLFKTPLMVACSTGNYTLAKYLLSQGADVNVQDQFQWTPLHHAALSGKPDVIQLLVEAGAPLNAVALNGGTPLMRAVESSEPSCVELLIDAGASVIDKNQQGQDCLDIATAYGNPTIIDMVTTKFQETMAILSSTNAKGEASPAPDQL